MNTETNTEAPDQETANVALMLEKEIDKRVAIALCRLLEPNNLGNIQSVGQAMDRGDTNQVSFYMARLLSMTLIQQGMLVNALIDEGSLMHNVRIKIAEHLNKNTY